MEWNGNGMEREIEPANTISTLLRSLVLSYKVTLGTVSHQASDISG